MEKSLKNYIEDITYTQAKDLINNLHAFNEFYRGSPDERKFGKYFNDIFNNLLQPSYMTSSDERTFDTLKEGFMQPALGVLIDYISLLKNYEDFREEEELYGSDGSFPDLSDITRDNSKDRHATYVSESRERLKEEIEV